MATTKDHPTADPLAVQLTASSTIRSLTRDLYEMSHHYEVENEYLRWKLLAKARALCIALETPSETMMRQCWAEPAAMCALTTISELDLWTYLRCVEGPFLVDDVAFRFGIDPILLCRLMRHLGTTGFLEEVASNTYKLTRFTKAMAVPTIGQGYPFISGACLGALNKFHEYIRYNGALTPNEPGGPHKYAYQTKSDLFDYLQAHPPYLDQFNLHMSGCQQGTTFWADPSLYPVGQRLVEGFLPQETQGSLGNEGPVLLVDIGGSIGHDMEKFIEVHPTAPGRFILQDLPQVIENATIRDVRIEAMPHDFHTPQPVQGARAYYMHSILHNWSDEDCVKILENIVVAMEPGYSRIVINEHVLPSTKAHSETTSKDILMLALFGRSRERCLAEWEGLFGKVGLKLNGVWSVNERTQSVMECELVAVY